jgi:hypothetical protein
MAITQRNSSGDFLRLSWFLPGVLGTLGLQCGHRGHKVRNSRHRMICHKYWTHLPCLLLAADVLVGVSRAGGEMRSPSALTFSRRTPEPIEE